MTADRVDHIFLIEDPRVFMKREGNGRNARQEVSPRICKEFSGKVSLSLYKNPQFVLYYCRDLQIPWEFASLFIDAFLEKKFDCNSCKQFPVHCYFEQNALGFEALSQLLTKAGAEVYRPRNPSTVKSIDIYKFLPKGSYTRINEATFDTLQIQKDRELTFSELAAQRELDSCF